jgi:hypothetical protein
LTNSKKYDKIIILEVKMKKEKVENWLNEAGFTLLVQEDPSQEEKEQE